MKRTFRTGITYLYILVKETKTNTSFFDPSAPNTDPSWFTGDDAESFMEQYCDADEQLPLDYMTPKPRGRPVTNTALFVDVSYAANKVTQSSHTGFTEHQLFGTASIMILSSQVHSQVNS